VASGAFVHLEQMAYDHWWMGLEAGGKHFHLNFGIQDGRLWVRLSDQGEESTENGKGTTGKGRFRELMDRPVAQSIQIVGFKASVCARTPALTNVAGLATVPIIAKEGMDELRGKSCCESVVSLRPGTTIRLRAAKKFSYHAPGPWYCSMFAAMEECSVQNE